jgi:hypothetical protein
MCRSIKTLRTEPEVTHDDVEAAALQYVRKISGYRKPSQVNQEAFDAAVREIADSTGRLLDRLVTKAPAAAH